jgi:hypothetical protein
LETAFQDALDERGASEAIRATRLYGEVTVLDIWIEPLSDNSRMVGNPSLKR